MIFPRFHGHWVTQLPPSLQIPPETDSRGSSGDAADYKTLRGIQRSPVWLPPVSGTETHIATDR